MSDEEPKKRRKRKLPKTVSRLEAELLLRAAGDHPRWGVRNRLMLEFMYRAGLRVSEVTNLFPRDVEKDGVVKLYDAKGGDGTAYFPPDDIVPLLEQWMIQRGELLSEVRYSSLEDVMSGMPLFINSDGSRITTRSIQRLVKRLKTKVGIRGIVTPHVFRHSMATEMIEEGFPVTEVQRQLRHADLATTSVYLHVRDESLRRKIANRIHPLDRGEV